MAAAGATIAIRLAALGLETYLFEKTPHNWRPPMCHRMPVATHIVKYLMRRLRCPAQTMWQDILRSLSLYHWCTPNGICSADARWRFAWGFIATLIDIQLTLIATLSPKMPIITKCSANLWKLLSALQPWATNCSFERERKSGGAAHGWWMDDTSCYIWI